MTREDSPSFACRTCGTRFSLPRGVLERYPGWTPRQCRTCRDQGRTTGSSRSGSSGSGSGAESAAGSADGVYTDGGASPNPGPGGWGAVYVRDGDIVAEGHGHEAETTNNRMELTALIEGAALVPEGDAAIVWSDSNLAVRTVNEWAAGWERRGWKRKSGPVENLDLVQRVYRIYRSRPELDLRWIKGHAGHRWNEYADALANRWRDDG